MSVQVKICGVTRVDDALAALDAGADLIGLNFYRPSPRYVGLDRAREISRAVAGRAKLVAVIVGAARELVARLCDELPLDFVQVYNDGGADEELVGGLPVGVIRALRLKAGAAREQLDNLRERASDQYVLLDSYDPKLYGGAGKPIALKDLQGLDLSRAFIAGGLRPETVAEAARLGPYGVDVASGIESSPGVKDHQKLRSFIRNAKSSR